MVIDSLAHDAVDRTDDLAAAALWLPPASLQTSEEEAADFAAAIEGVTHQFSRAVLQLFSVPGDHHRHEPHGHHPETYLRAWSFTSRSVAASADAFGGEAPAATCDSG